MRQEKLRAVCVCQADNVDEFYEVGNRDVTAIEWGEVSGHMSMIDTVRVFKDGVLWSEHTFTSILGVYFAKEE